MSQKVIIDADPGIGDAVAIALALLDPNLDIVGVTATAGAVSGADATRNIQVIVEQLDPPKHPRLGSSSEIAAGGGESFGASVVRPVDLNGPRGLGDCDFSVAELHHRHESAKLMIDLVRTNPDEIMLLTLGPLTNLEIACERAPEFLELLNGLVCLGGSVAGGGDVTAAAEFNIQSNPEAARNVLRSPATKTLIPLDVSSQAVMTFEQFDRLPKSNNSPLAAFLEALLPFSFRAHHQHLGLEGIRLKEVVAVAYLSQPRLFDSEPMAIDVETAGRLTRGMTVFDRRGIQQWQTNIDVLCEVDVQGIIDYFSRIVRGAGG